MTAANESTNENPFAAGHDFWFVSEAETSLWSRKIDWYLGFELSRAHRHESAKWSSEIEQIMSQNKMQVPGFSCAANAPLICASERVFPNRSVVQIPFQGEAEDWLQKVFNTWTSLKQPLARVFLPTGVSLEAARRKFSDSRISFVA